MLRIKATISVPQLAVKFGCARVQAMAQRNLNEVPSGLRDRKIKGAQVVFSF